MLQSLPAYAASTCKLEKSKIVSIIVDTVRQRSPDGGFIKCFDDEWVEVGDKMAREKVSRAKD